MRFRERRDDGAEAETRPSRRTELEDELGEECEALLGGHYLSYARRESLPLHGWMWLNLVAHGSFQDVVGAAVGAGAPGWDAAAAVVAHATVGAAKTPEGLRAVQHDVLVPLELGLIGTDVTPRRLLEVTLAALYGTAPA